MKRYIILGKNKKSGQYVGFHEASFLMCMSKRSVSVWTSTFVDMDYDVEEARKELKSDAKTTYLWDCKVRACTKPNSKNQYKWFFLREICMFLNVADKDHIWRPYRVGSKFCPVTIGERDNRSNYFFKMKHTAN